MIVTVILYFALPGVVLSTSQEMLEIVEENCKVCCRTVGQVQLQDYNLNCICSNNMIPGYKHCAADSHCDLCLNYTMSYDALNCIALLYDSSNSNVIDVTHAITAMIHVQCSTEESSTSPSMTIAKATSEPLITTLTTLLAGSSILTISEPPITSVKTLIITESPIYVTVSEPLIITLSITIPVIVITTVLSIILITYLITSKRRGLNHDTAATTSNITELGEHSNYYQVQPDPGAVYNTLDPVYNVLDPIYNTLDPIHNEDTQPNPPQHSTNTTALCNSAVDGMLISSQYSHKATETEDNH